MDSPLLTVFTPAYNRADLLPVAYKALQKQTSKNFKWLIIDDGSTDNTGELVAEWIKQEKEFSISYYYKENGGLHTAYNAAIERLDTELAVCVDSDDYLPEDAVERITSFWKKYGSDEYAGIAGLDYDTSGNKIGDPFPDQKSINLIDLAIGKYHIHAGDIKLVVRSDLYQSVAPMGSFEGEKFFNPNYLHMEISKKYDFLVLNECLCVVDYQPQGMSSNMFRQYYDSPQSYAELRKQHLSFKGIGLKYKFKEYVHYISSCCLAKKGCGLKNKNWPLFIFACPFGLLLSILVRWKNR